MTCGSGFRTRRCRAAGRGGGCSALLSKRRCGQPPSSTIPSQRSTRPSACCTKRSPECFLPCSSSSTGVSGSSPSGDTRFFRTAWRSHRESWAARFVSGAGSLSLTYGRTRTTSRVFRPSDPRQRSRCVTGRVVVGAFNLESERPLPAGALELVRPLVAALAPLTEALRASSTLGLLGSCAALRLPRKSPRSE